MRKILYISYDGMTDPLGQSQVLPYLVNLAKEGYIFTILSFEKKERLEKNKKIIEEITRVAGITWVPLSFTRKPPLLSKLYDTIRLRQKAISLQRKNKFDMVHCRSYIAADIGLLLKRKFGIKFFFDMRGFWADEKKDGGAWSQENFIFRKVYQYYKKKEAEYLQNADCIILLTEAGKKEMVKWSSFNSTAPVSVIPCCTDMSLFTVTNALQKAEGRKLLNLKPDSFVLSYLGSVGAWYMLDEMLELFRYIKEEYPNAIFLFVTHSDKRMIIKKAISIGLKETDIQTVEASRQEVPLFIKASDVSVSFIKPVYSKISSSPTKLGEILSMGIPIISNSGVGDVKEIIEYSKGGIVINEFNQAEYKKVIAQLPQIVSIDPSLIRNNIKDIYSLEKGVVLYSNMYKKVFSK